MATLQNAVDDATFSPRAHRPKPENRLVRVLQLWHLLSLDAPTVAMLWTWFVARTNHVALPVTAILAMGIAVWMLYAADRLLDTRTLNDRIPIANAVILSGSKNPRISLEAPVGYPPELEPRHYFHRHHQRAFRFAILIASLALAVLLPSLAPQAIRLYLALGTLLFGYFVIIHVNSAAAPSKNHRLPKEIAVGIFFSAAIFIPTVARNPALRLALLPGAVLFAILCCMNCLFIYTWEHPIALDSSSSPSSPSQPQPHRATKLALRFLPTLAVAIALTSFILFIANRSLPWPIPFACGIASLLLVLLHKNRHRLSATTLRAAADLCLLTPLLLLPLLLTNN